MKVCYGDYGPKSKAELDHDIAEGLRGRFNAQGDVQENRGLRLLLDLAEHSVLEIVPAITVQPGRLINSLRRAGWVIANRLDHSSGKKRSFYTLVGWQKPNPQGQVATPSVPVPPHQGTAPMFREPLVPFDGGR